MKRDCSIFFLNSANLVCRGSDISKYFRESLGVCDNESTVCRVFFARCLSLSYRYKRDQRGYTISGSFLKDISGLSSLVVWCFVAMQRRYVTERQSGCLAFTNGTPWVMHVVLSSEKNVTNFED